MYFKGIEESAAALKVAEDLDCVELKAMTLGNLGLAYRLIGDYERAVQFHKRGIAESEKNCHVRGVATVIWAIWASHTTMRVNGTKH
jgi:hypothetical protein